MKGPAPIEMPNHFTLEWYKAQKELKKTDKMIAKELVISTALLSKWKRKIGWETGKIFRLINGRPRTLDPVQIIALKEQGLSGYAIAKKLNVSAQAIHYWLNAL